MRAPTIVVTGTGTEIGKTHVGAALLKAWSRAWTPALTERGGAPRIAGIKPVESGAPRGELGLDARTLGQASTFHVKHSPPYMLVRAVSPHLAARDEGTVIDVDAITSYVRAARGDADGLLVELAGGLFSPLTTSDDGRALTNADVAGRIEDARLLLVAPDRLGVLHDVGATIRAASAAGVGIHAVLLVTPADPDASTGTNLAELRCVTTVPALGPVPRAPVDALATSALLRDVLTTLGLDHATPQLDR